MEAEGEDSLGDPGSHKRTNLVLNDIANPQHGDYITTSVERHNTSAAILHNIKKHWPHITTIPTDMPAWLLGALATRGVGLRFLGVSLDAYGGGTLLTFIHPDSTDTERALFIRAAMAVWHSSRAGSTVDTTSGRTTKKQSPLPTGAPKASTARRLSAAEARAAAPAVVNAKSPAVVVATARAAAPPHPRPGLPSPPPLDTAPRHHPSPYLTDPTARIPTQPQR
eukprot:jgi/Tetstr1/439692/TSEL_028111.t1